jgi:thiamine kinase-like enzyme
VRSSPRADHERKPFAHFRKYDRNKEGVSLLEKGHTNLQLEGMQGDIFKVERYGQQLLTFCIHTSFLYLKEKSINKLENLCPTARVFFTRS